PLNSRAHLGSIRPSLFILRSSDVLLTPAIPRPRSPPDGHPTRDARSDSLLPRAFRRRDGSQSNSRTNRAPESALPRNCAQNRTAWSGTCDGREVPRPVYAAEKRSGLLRNSALCGRCRRRIEEFFDIVSTGTYIRPRVANDTHAPEPFPTITWSWIFRSTRWAASTSCRVSRISSLDGAGSPDG